jgi:voltage-gated potassium channel
LREAGTAVLLVIATLWLQCAGVAVLIGWARRALESNVQRLGPFRSAGLVVRTTVGILLLHIAVILLWASFYRWLCFPSWETSFYFSASCYSTVGYGDVVLPLTWRILGPLESMTGVLMAGISVCVLFTLIRRLVGAKYDPRSVNELIEQEKQA